MRLTTGKVAGSPPGLPPLRSYQATSPELDDSPYRLRVISALATAMEDPDPMTISANELQQELARTEATMIQVVRRAGRGTDPEFNRRLDRHARCLRAMLDANGLVVAMDTLEAARRAMDAADPAAPLLMLAISRENLAAVVRRQASRSPSGTLSS